MSHHASAEDAQPCEPVRLPPLYRSEGFAEDLLDSADCPDDRPEPLARVKDSPGR
jgi:hypothetical protein